MLDIINTQLTINRHYNNSIFLSTAIPTGEIRSLLPKLMQQLSSVREYQNSIS